MRLDRTRCSQRLNARIVASEGRVRGSTGLARERKMGRKRTFPSFAPRFTGRRPSSISIEGRTYATESWREVLLKTCEFVRTRKPSEFSRILELKGSRRLWFSRRREGLYAPIKIRGTDIFAESNVNANGLVMRSLHVLNLFGLKPEIEIVIEK
jgi:hypothetical protein